MNGLGPQTIPQLVATRSCAIVCAKILKLHKMPQSFTWQTISSEKKKRTRKRKKKKKVIVRALGMGPTH